MNATAVKERPILMSAPMVNAILEGRKTQTRRLVKFNHKPWLEPLPVVEYARDGMPIWWSSPPSERVRQSDYYDTGYPCPYGGVGERLWVRETWNKHGGLVTYRADGDWISNFKASADSLTELGKVEATLLKWKPSIFMLREYSRISLEVTDVRVERLQDITESDAECEGFEDDFEADPCPMTARDQFASLWEKINGNGTWSNDPWVWVVEFKRVKEPA